MIGQREIGFSLIEIMITMVILSFVIYGTMTMVNRNQRLASVLHEEFALFHEVRAAMTSLENDVSMLFILKPRFDFQNRQEIYDAVFIGSPKKFSAATMNYQKRVADQRDTNLKEIEYFIVSDESAHEGEPAFILMKKRSSFLDEPLFGSGVSYAVLTDLKSFSFEYYFEKDRTWVTEWDSRKGKTKNLLPRAVSVAFELYQRDPDVPEKKPKILTFQTKFLVDSAIEKERVFELSQSVQQLQKLLGGQKPQGTPALPVSPQNPSQGASQ